MIDNKARCTQIFSWGRLEGHFWQYLGIFVPISNNYSGSSSQEILMFITQRPDSCPGTVKILKNTLSMIRTYLLISLHLHGVMGKHYYHLCTLATKGWEQSSRLPCLKEYTVPRKTASAGCVEMLSCVFWPSGGMSVVLTIHAILWKFGNIAAPWPWVILTSMRNVHVSGQLVS